MSAHYFIDGYNLLHSTDRWADIPRKQQREKFLRFLDEERPTGSERNLVTVVLDGYSVDLEKLRWSLLQVIFSGDRDADTVIKEKVDALPHPRSAIVVTNDRDIRNWVRRKGAKVMSCEDFLKLGQSKKTSVKKPPDSLDPETAHHINTELERLWKMD
jgi:predicted RNA-binding protein with PIN domain